LAPRCRKGAIHPIIEVEGFRSLEIDNKFELGRQNDRQAAWFFSLEDAIDVICRSSPLLDLINSIRY
jgi:hypothetical protein